MPLMNEYNKDTIKESILNKLLRYYGTTIEEATPKQIYAAVASTVRDQIMLKWRFEKEARRDEKAKRLYYLSIEFLTGRWLHNNLLNLCSTKEYEEAFTTTTNKPIYGGMGIVRIVENEHYIAPVVDEAEDVAKKEADEDREKRMQRAMLNIKTRFGPNAVMKGTSYQEAATGIERNESIGGHKA